MTNKSIAILLNRYSEDNFLSGGEKVDFFLVKAFAELGFEIDLFCNESTVNNSKYIKNIGYYSKDYNFVREKYLFTLAENFEFDRTFLYIHENSRHFRNKYTRTPFSRFLQNIFARKRKKVIDELLRREKMIVENTPFLLVPSNIVKNDLLEFFKVKEENIFILPPAINKAESIEKKENNIFTFGLSARGFGNKGGWQVILSCFFLKLLGKKFKILIIYPFSKSLNFLKIIVALLGLSNNITFLNYCSNMQEEFYSKIDCLIMASKREAFGLVGAEAMQIGIPAIVSSRCGIKDFIINNENGFVYDYNRPLYNLFKIMLYVVNNKSNLCNISDKAKQIYENLTFDKLKGNIENILKTTKYL